jgi:hypothetical protein
MKLGYVIGGQGGVAVVVDESGVCERLLGLLNTAPLELHWPNVLTTNSSQQLVAVLEHGMQCRAWKAWGVWQA